MSELSGHAEVRKIILLVHDILEWSSPIEIIVRDIEKIRQSTLFEM